LFPLLHIQKQHPDATVAVFPSDHFVLEEDRLMSYVRLASITVQRDPARLVLLGVKPDAAETEYGYILTGRKVAAVAAETSEITWFIEKPDKTTARRLVNGGGLWNTMIMVFRAATMLHWVRKLTPALYRDFSQLQDVIGTEAELSRARELYRRLKPVNFSKDLLEPMVSRLPASVLTLPVRNVLWSDWGTEARIIEVLRRTGNLHRLNRRPRGVPRRIHPESPIRPGRLPEIGKNVSVEPV
jgi:mannose-1-phosphate guanylyltransferase